MNPTVILEVLTSLASLATGIFEIVKILGMLGAAAALFTILFVPGGKTKVAQLVSNIVGGAVSVATPLVTDLSAELGDIVAAFVAGITIDGPAISQNVAEPIGNLAAANFATADSNLATAGESLPTNATAQASAAFKQAYGFGVSSAAVTAAFEALFPEKLNVLNGAGPALSNMAGFAEVSKAVLGPLYHTAFGKALEYKYAEQFTPLYVAESKAAEWHARGIMTDDDAAEVFTYSGLKTKYLADWLESGYRPMQPRALVNLVQDTPFPTADMQTLMTFAGIRLSDQAIVLPLMEIASMKNVRNQYLAATVSAAEEGIVTADQLQQAMTDLGFSGTAQNFVQLTVATKKLQQLAELYRKSVTDLYKSNQLTDAQYVPALEAIGIAEPDADAHFAIDSAIVHGKAIAAAARAEVKEASAITSNSVKTARTQLLSGAIDLPVFSAAIAASGLDLALVPGVIALASAQLAARQRNVFGLLVTPAQAVLLREKVSDLGKQVTGGLMTPAAALATLASLNIPPANAQALVTGWEATKTPAADVGVLGQI